MGRAGSCVWWGLLALGLGAGCAPVGAPRVAEGEAALRAVGAAFVRLPAGRFSMGSAEGQAEAELDERPPHAVTLTRSFELLSTEVTQALWERVMGNNPSQFEGRELPVEQVSWYDAVGFCNALSRRLGLDEAYVLTEQRGRPGEVGYSAEVRWKGAASPGYRLPTEAEWEYAARAGTTGPRYASLDAAAWHSGNSDAQTHPVGQRSPNPWGLYDLLGNVWEWTGDWYGPYEVGSATDPAGPATGSDRVIRGGGWLNAGGTRAAFRGVAGPERRDLALGFRVARSLP